MTYSDIGSANFAMGVLKFLGKDDPLKTTECHNPSCSTCYALHKDYIKEVNDLAEAIRKQIADIRNRYGDKRT